MKTERQYILERMAPVELAIYASQGGSLPPMLQRRLLAWQLAQASLEAAKVRAALRPRPETSLDLSPAAGDLRRRELLHAMHFCQGKRARGILARVANAIPAPIQRIPQRQTIRKHRRVA